jgi:disulfide bond formation protein DsbB
VDHNELLCVIAVVVVVYQSPDLDVRKLSVFLVSYSMITSIDVSIAFLIVQPRPQCRVSFSWVRQASIIETA